MTMMRKAAIRTLPTEGQVGLGRIQVVIERL